MLDVVNEDGNEEPDYYGNPRSHKEVSQNILLGGDVTSQDNDREDVVAIDGDECTDEEKADPN